MEFKRVKCFQFKMIKWNEFKMVKSFQFKMVKWNEFKMVKRNSIPNNKMTKFRKWVEWVFNSGYGNECVLDQRHQVVYVDFLRILNNYLQTNILENLLRMQGYVYKFDPRTNGRGR